MLLLYHNKLNKNKSRNQDGKKNKMSILKRVFQIFQVRDYASFYGSCIHERREIDEREGILCYLTGYTCVCVTDFDSKGNPQAGDDQIAHRCPMFNINPKGLFRRDLAEKVREAKYRTKNLVIQPYIK